MKTRPIHCLPFLLCLAVLVGACDIGKREKLADQAAFAPAAAPMYEMEVKSADMRRAEGAGGQAAPGLGVYAMAQPDRYLIKDAVVSLEVDDAQQVADSILMSVKAAGGYLADMSVTARAIGQRHITLQVRVPSDKFEDSMRQFETLGRVLDQRVTSQDVTEEYVDTDAKVRNLKRAEERLLEHLQRTAKLEDIIKVEQELTRVRGEIERHEGRLKFLANKVAFSTITISLSEAAKAQAVLPAKAFSTASVATEAMRSLVSFAQILWIKVIWLGVWSVAWLPIALIVYFLIRRYRKKRVTGNAGI